MLALVVISIMPASERPVTGAGSGFEHLAAFSLTGALFALGYGIRSTRLALYAVLACAFIELVQLPFPTRHPRLTDFLLDAFASVLAIASVAVLRQLAARNFLIREAAVAQSANLTREPAGSKSS